MLELDGVRKSEYYKFCPSMNHRIWNTVNIWTAWGYIFLEYATINGPGSQVKVCVSVDHKITRPQSWSRLSATPYCVCMSNWVLLILCWLRSSAIPYPTFMDLIWCRVALNCDWKKIRIERFSAKPCHSCTIRSCMVWWVFWNRSS